MNLGLKKTNEKYLYAFLIAFGLFYLIMLPMIVYNKGIFLYYGDFNSQQLHFYQLAHDAVRNGDFFWNWNTDLGANFIGSYSFYLLGSPFFWLTIPFPSEAVIYLMPILLALKFAVASLTAYTYIRRFVKTPNAALIGGLLYAFSGFQAYNVFFNHFQDVTAFFPLLLIAMEERIVNNRRGVFAITVALMAVINYFFFSGEVVFCVIYFIIRCFSKDFNVTPRKFFGLMLEAVLGVMLAAFMLLPSALAIIGNPRTKERLLGYDMIVYNEKFRIFQIIQSFFMIPDNPARPNLFDAQTGKWSSIAGFLPLFSMAGVLSFIKQKKQHWATRIFVVCMVMAFVPILNSAFSGFTSSYYARWYFMPILIMAMMTAYAVDNNKIDLRYGTYISMGAIVVFAVIGALPSKAGDVTKYFKLPKYPAIFAAMLFISFVNIFILYALIRHVKRDKSFLQKALAATIIACFACTGAMVWYGTSMGPYPKPFIKEAINGKENISLPKDYFYRIDISENMDNYTMSWGIPSIRCFQSIVPASIMEFYPTVGVTRDVASRADLSKYALRGLFSVKYYFDYHAEDDKTPFYLAGFTYYDQQNGFDIYENKHYVPMGFTFDKYMTRDTYDLQNKEYTNRMLMKAIVLDKFQALRNSDILTQISTEDLTKISEDDYLEDCDNRASEACYSFDEDTRGFTAKINLSKENLVFFSVPYDKGFTATVDGKAASIEKVDVGFMAVRVPAGDHEIRFNYFPQGLKTGAIISLFALILLGTYLFIFRKKKHEHNSNFYDYNTEIEIPAKEAYEQQLLNIFKEDKKKGQ